MCIEKQLNEDSDKISEGLNIEVSTNAKNIPGFSWSLEVDSAGWSKRNGFTLEVFKDSLFLLGGTGWDNYNGAVWTSNNIENWTVLNPNPPWGPRWFHRSEVFNDKIYVFGGWHKSEKGKNDVWCSSDGNNWNLVTSSSAWKHRTQFASVVFDNKLWVLGGHHIPGNIGNGYSLNDVWFSSDGKNWNVATEHPGWNPRNSHMCIVFDDRMWVVGGYANKLFYNDVWYSKDGFDWHKTDVEIPWLPRSGASCLVYKGKIWLSGGQNDQYFYLPDGWVTENGINWHLYSYDAPWFKRSNFTGVSFNDGVYIMGGFSIDGWKQYNDIWKYPGF